jgi:hypothetical protein
VRPVLLVIIAVSAAYAGPFAPPVGQPGTTAIYKSDPSIVGWATTVTGTLRGPTNISDPNSLPASQGAESEVLGPANADISDSFNVLSLGDGGKITVGFDKPIANGPGPDFAVFENSINNTFLELAFVEVSSDGGNFFRFPAISLTPTAMQVGTFGSIDATNIYNLAGKYSRGYGTPFDLAELAGIPGLDLQNINYVRVVDVVGSIDPAYATYDSQGHKVNDPWPTDFDTGGFDLDAVAVLHQAVPEPGCATLFLLGGAMLIRRRRAH